MGGGGGWGGWSCILVVARIFQQTRWMVHVLYILPTRRVVIHEIIQSNQCCTAQIPQCGTGDHTPLTCHHIVLHALYPRSPIFLFSVLTCATVCCITFVPADVLRFYDQQHFFLWNVRCEISCVYPPAYSKGESNNRRVVQNKKLGVKAQTKSLIKVQVWGCADALSPAALSLMCLCCLFCFVLFLPWTTILLRITRVGHQWDDNIKNSFRIPANWV